ncbi:hypothetical protein H0X32_01125 [Patescibacteria group bacterium]|nr:hypothetical protein [Patescibacteria group bacterium]
MKNFLPLIVILLVIIGGGAAVFAGYTFLSPPTQLPIATTTDTTIITNSTTTTTTTTSIPPKPPGTGVPPTSQGTGTLEGRMTIGPVCPVEQAGHPCTPTPEMYAAHPVSVYSSDRARLITTLTPDANGNFSAALPVGKYVVDVQRQPIGGARGVPATISISKDQTTPVSIDIDTGIR